MELSIEQEIFIQRVRENKNTMHELESMLEQRSNPQLGVQDYPDKSDADLALDNLPTRDFLERQMRGYLNEAPSIGLGNHPDIIKIRRAYEGMDEERAPTSR